MAIVPTLPTLGAIVVPLLRGVIARDEDAQRWHALLQLQAAVRDYVATLGLTLVLDEGEGHAFLAQRSPAEGEQELPRLLPRRPLSYQVSLLLVLLRRRLSEHDASSGETRLVLSRSAIAELVRAFLPETADERRFLDRLDGHIAQAEKLGFLRSLRGREQEYEVRRIIKAFVDAQWLQDFAQRLESYRQAASQDAAPEGSP